MNAVSPIRPAVRTLAHVLLDLNRVRAMEAATVARFDREPTNGDCHRIGDELAALDDQQFDLCAEARAMVEAVTGIRWDVLHAANL